MLFKSIREHSIYISINTKAYIFKHFHFTAYKILYSSKTKNFSKVSLNFVFYGYINCDWWIVHWVWWSGIYWSDVTVFRSTVAPWTWPEEEHRSQGRRLGSGGWWWPVPMAWCCICHQLTLTLLPRVLQGWHALTSSYIVPTVWSIWSITYSYWSIGPIVAYEIISMLHM